LSTLISAGILTRFLVEDVSQMTHTNRLYPTERRQEKLEAAFFEQLTSNLAGRQ